MPLHNSIAIALRTRARTYEFTHDTTHNAIGVRARAKSANSYRIVHDLNLGAPQKHTKHAQTYILIPECKNPQ